MSAYKIVSGGERVGKSPVGGPALQPPDLWARSVIRRSGRRLTEFYRAVEWDYARLWLGVFATVFVLVYVARVRGR